MSLSRIFRNSLLRDEAFGPSFSPLLGQVYKMMDETAFPAIASSSRNWRPRCDAKETEKDFQIHADLPGVKKEDISIEADGQSLTISGKTEEMKEDKNETYHYSERSSGSFMRTFSLPKTADMNSIKAEYDNGVLKVSVPKIKEDEATPKKKIDIM